MLEVAQVPDGHPVRKRVAAAFKDLESVIREVPSVGLNAGAIFHPGPAVYVMRNEDIRNWPTTHGLSAREELVSRSKRTASLATQTRKLVASRKLISTKRRVLSSKEYLAALAEAEAVD